MILWWAYLTNMMPGGPRDWVIRSVTYSGFRLIFGGIGCFLLSATILLLNLGMHFPRTAFSVRKRYPIDWCELPQLIQYLEDCVRSSLDKMNVGYTFYEDRKSCMKLRREFTFHTFSVFHLEQPNVFIILTKCTMPAKDEKFKGIDAVGLHIRPANNETKTLILKLIHGIDEELQSLDDFKAENEFPENHEPRGENCTGK